MIALPFCSTPTNFQTWITCGAYAMIHALQAQDIDLLELENSTGVTFGIASLGSDFHYTRMLMPLKTFWEGMFSAAPLWGIRIKLFRFQELEELRNFLKSVSDMSLVLGPVSMAGLHYLPCATQYKCADHYIALRPYSENRGNFILTDSEGIPAMPITATELSIMCNITNIPEAQECYTVGVVSRDDVPQPPQVRHEYILDKAQENFLVAEQSGQGSGAFLRCARLISETDIHLWRGTFLYDLSYFIQRREMLLLSLTTLPTSYVQLPELIWNQICLAAHTRRLLSTSNTPDINAVSKSLEDLAILEKSLALEQLSH